VLTETTVTYLGDLYRFYTDESGEVLHVYFYAMMGTSEQEMDLDEIPPEVIEQFETAFMQ